MNARLGVAVFTLASTIAWGRDASACGGFFCDGGGGGPRIDQSGERVLFVVEDGHVQAHIQIQFVGEATEFSWVVPVATVPTVSAGSDELFTALMQSTLPSFPTQNRTENCDDGSFGGDADADADSDADTDSDGDADSVSVIAQGVAGPYDYLVIDSDDPTALQTWLVDNGYDVPDNALPIIASYVEAGMHFLGLKLAKGQDVGDLRPVVLDLDQDEACLPIRLTAIAATADMPITIWVLADAQATSTNYPEVWLNDLSLYTSYYADYSGLVDRAIDEVGGRAFLVDYAGSDDTAALFLQPDRYDTSALRSLDAPAFMVELQQQGLYGNALLATLLETYLPVPAELAAEGVTQADFQQCVACAEYEGMYYGCPRCYGEELDALGYTFDANAFADAIESAIVDPLVRAAEPFARLPTLTRLYTRMSPSEMTVDPIFATNPDLPEVPLGRLAIRTTHCDGGGYTEWLTANGVHACASGAFDTTGPAALVAIQQKADGPGEVVLDNRGDAQTANDCDVALDWSDSNVIAGRFRSTNPPATSREGSLCSVSGSARGGWLVLVPLALAGLARRRRIA